MHSQEVYDWDLSLVQEVDKTRCSHPPKCNCPQEQAWAPAVVQTTPPVRRPPHLWTFRVRLGF